jgi:sugar phosphate isomerase/epimerase
MPQASVAVEAGFDYVEVGVSQFALDEPFDPNRYRAARAETANLFFPGTFRLYDMDRGELEAYIETSIIRARQIGLQVLVVGSGAARAATNGLAIEEAEQQFIALIASIQGLAGKHGVKVAPESLNQTETNVFNRSADLSKALAQVGVGYTADSYHILRESESLEEAIPFLPTHVHISNGDRKAPSPNDPEMIAFAKRLHELGYTGRVSIEASRSDDDLHTFQSMLADLKTLFAPPCL